MAMVAYIVVRINPLTKSKVNITRTIWNVYPGPISYWISGVSEVTNAICVGMECRTNIGIIIMDSSLVCASWVFATMVLPTSASSLEV